MDLILVTSEEKALIRKYYNVSEFQIKECVKLLKIWMYGQSHLPQNLTDALIENMLARNKFEIELTKQKLNNYFSLRRSNRDLVQNFDSIVPSKQITTYLPMPKLSPNLERIVVIKMINPNPDHYDIYKFCKINLAVEEMSLHYDYAIGVRFLYDFAYFTLLHLAKVIPQPLATHIILLEEAYSCRILGFEFINFPSFASGIVDIMKAVMRPKIYERVRIHKNIRSVHEVIPKECLPLDYGGSLSSVSDLLIKWDEAVKNHSNFFLDNYRQIS